ncbi:MAG: ABC transporter permease [Streptosporangiaceae bacterium]
MRLAAEWTRLEWQRRWRSLVALALLVAVSTGTVLTAIAGARRGETAFTRLWARSMPATVTVLPNQPGFDWAKIRKLPEVAALTTFAVAQYQIDGYPLARQSVGFPPGDDELFRTIERPSWLAGGPFNPHRLDQVDVTPLFPANYGKGVGDTLTIRLPTVRQADAGWDPSSGQPARGPKIKVRIVGVGRSPWFSDSVGSFGGVQVSPVMLTRYPDNFLGSNHRGYVNALVRLKGGQDAIPRFRRDLARVSGRSDIDVWDNLANFGEPTRRTTEYEAACLLAFGIAALAAALFLVGQSVARYTAASVSDLQLLRAPGITPRETMLAASASPFLASVAGAALGVAAAIVASNWMPIGAAALLEPSPGVSADWAILGPGWAAAPVLVLLGSLAAAYATAAASRAQQATRRSLVAAAAVSAGAPVPMLIGARFALEPGRGRSALPVRPALVGAVAGVLGVLAAFTFSAGVSDAAANPARFGQTDQLETFIGENGKNFVPEAKLASALAASHDVIGLNDSRTAVAQSGQVSISTYTYAPVGGKRMPIVLTAGRLPIGPDEIVLAPTTASELHATTGSDIKLVGGSHQVAVTVTGIGFVPEGPHNEYDGGAWMTSAGYDRLFHDATYRFKFRGLQIVLRHGVGVAAATNRLNAIARSVLGGRTPGFGPPPLPQAILEVRDVAVLPFALGAFLALLALGAVGHALATAVRRRRHELAVLRALGVTRLQSRLVVITQATLLAAIGLAFGVPLGIVLGRVTWRLVAHATPLFYHPPLAAIAVALVGPLALLLANLLATWPGHRAARLHSAQILRTE